MVGLADAPSDPLPDPQLARPPPDRTRTNRPSPRQEAESGATPTARRGESCLVRRGGAVDSATRRFVRSGGSLYCTILHDITTIPYHRFPSIPLGPCSCHPQLSPASQGVQASCHDCSPWHNNSDNTPSRPCPTLRRIERRLAARTSQAPSMPLSKPAHQSLPSIPTRVKGPVGEGDLLVVDRKHLFRSINPFLTPTTHFLPHHRSLPNFTP